MKLSYLTRNRGASIPRPQTQDLPHEEIVEKSYEMACRIVGVDRESLVLKSRRHDLVLARAIFMWVMIHESRVSLCRIGLMFNRDYSTVIHGYKMLKNRIQTDPGARHDLILYFGWEGLKKARTAVQEITPLFKNSP